MVQLEVPGAQVLERVRRHDVQDPATWLDKLGVRYFANPLVGEIEAFANTMQHAPPYELFNALGGVRLVKPGGTLEEPEIKLTSNDGGDRGEMPPTVAKAVQATRHDSPHPLR
jgi:hypothetical protein